jgi:amino acid transporter
MQYNPRWGDEPAEFHRRRYIPPPPPPERTWWGIGVCGGILVVTAAVMAFTYAMNYVSPSYVARAQSPIHLPLRQP